MEALRKRPKPLVIDIYLDTTHLAQNQTLVAIDDDGRRWDVGEALVKASTGSDAPLTDLIYERWTIDLVEPSAAPTAQLSDPPPNVYKKGVVMLKSLYTYARFLPGWKFSHRIARNSGNGNGPMPKPRYRITNAMKSGEDTLGLPLSTSGPVTEEYHFAALPCVLGLLKVSVKYRTNCNFELDTAERLLSEKFAPSTAISSFRTSDSTSGELSQDSRYKPWARMPSTEEEDIANSATRPSPVIQPAVGSRSSLRADAIPPSSPRRPSVSFQPFKAGSLSSSPGSALMVPPSPGGSLPKNAGISLPQHNRSRSSLNTLPQQALRTPGLTNETVVASSGSSSPKPAPIQRYSSSFGNRKARFSSSVGSKTEEDGNSSRGSVSSSTHRASITLNEAESASHEDSENISDFIKLLEKSSHGLPSFNKTDQASLDANSQRTAAQYSKFAKMKDSTAQFSDSLSSSLMLQRSSTSSSRQLSNVPGLVSTSSSPGKAVSPHTPHMPAIPSRLSNNSIAEYSREESRSRTRQTPTRADSIDEDRAGGSTGRDRGTTAIDIPTSPRTFPTSRRSSSVHHQQPRTSSHNDDDVMPFGLRSASVPNDERPTYAVEDDEPLLFAMGELGSQRRFD